MNSLRAGRGLELPTSDDAPESTNSQIEPSLKKLYQNAHTYHINSLAMNSDMQTFISGDDLRINWWNLEISDTCFSKLLASSKLLSIALYLL